MFPDTCRYRHLFVAFVCGTRAQRLLLPRRCVDAGEQVLYMLRCSGSAPNLNEQFFPSSKMRPTLKAPKHLTKRNESMGIYSCSLFPLPEGCRWGNAEKCLPYAIVCSGARTGLVIKRLTAMQHAGYPPHLLYHLEEISSEINRTYTGYTASYPRR
jgi:hypothetical protein